MRIIFYVVQANWYNNNANPVQGLIFMTEIVSFLILHLIVTIAVLLLLYQQQKRKQRIRLVWPVLVKQHLAARKKAIQRL